MPELPEVETVRAQLSAKTVGQQIKSVKKFHPRAINPRTEHNLDSLIGAQINSVNRRGKYLWFQLNRPYALVAHLGMSGQFYVQPSKDEPQKHLRAIFELSSGDSLRFLDQRTFGWVSVEQLHEQIPTSALHIALDQFDDNFDSKKVIANFRRRKVQIKTALLNQEIMSGVGNIYADEALWRAKINPRKMTNKLTEEDLRKILSATKSVMSAALKAGGTSFDTQYRNVNGESGYFERRLRVYGRDGLACGRCRTKIKKIAFANRHSHFCPKCQR